MQHAVCKNMSALRVGSQLSFVDCNESKIPFDWHRLHSAAIPPRVRRLDPLFTSNQRNLRRTLDRHHPIIDFPCQKPQRKTHHAARIAAHSLNREMRFAGVGRPQDGGQFGIIAGQKTVHSPETLSSPT